MGNYEKGTVTLPIEEYNRLLLENLKFRSAFKLRKTYNDGVELRIDDDFLKQHVTEEFAKSEFAADYVMRDDIYGAQCYIADRKGEVSDDE